MKSLFLLAGLCAVGLTAHAQMISIANSDFENPYPLADGTYQPSLPNWVDTGSGAGEVSFSAAGYTGTSDGNNVAYDDSGSLVYQNLSDTYQAGTYTLTFALGNRPGVASAGGYISLFDQSGQQLASTGVVDTSTSGTGVFTDYSLTYVVAPGSLVIGQGISVIFGGGNEKGVTGIGNSDFDNARLTFAAPEPSTYVLILGGVCLLSVAYRVRKSVLS